MSWARPLFDTASYIVEVAEPILIQALILKLPVKTLDEMVNMYVFRTLYEFREITEKWTREYNEERPHDSLCDLTPLEYLATRNRLENSNPV